jgi:hypothetical protein
VDVDHGQLVEGRLKDVAVILNLDELAPVGGRPASRRDRRRFERLAEECEDLSDRPWLGDERDAVVGALQPFGSFKKWLRGRDIFLAVELCPAGGGTRSASLSRNSNGQISTTSLAPGRVWLHQRPRLTQLAALCAGGAGNGYD